MLAENFVIALPEVVSQQVSADGTRKYLVRIAGGHEVEIVYIPEEDRGTLCISSPGRLHADLFVLPYRHAEAGAQPDRRRDRRPDHAGARRSGRMARARRHRKNETRLLSNIVLMGMGEPLYNFENVRDAMKIAMDGEGISLSRPPHHAVDLAASCPRSPAAPRKSAACWRCRFHATTDEVRDKLVPINKRWNIATLLDALRDYPKAVELRADHLRIRDAEGRERQRRGRAPAGEADRGHPGQDQPDPVQRMARRALRAVGLEPDPGLCRHRLQGRLCLARSARRGARTSWPPAAS